jgi:alpha-D-xyloside xylohydrolase
VPWIFDQEAVDVTRIFTKLKLTLMPYLYAVGLEASATGTPVMRPMQLEFPDDPAVGHLDRQYMLGADLLVAPVFTASGDVEFYLPAGTWTNYFTRETVTGGTWRRENHGFTSLPLYVREGAVIPTGARDDRPDYNYLDGLVLDIYPGASRSVTVTTPSADSATFSIAGGTVTSDSGRPFAVRVGNGEPIRSEAGKVDTQW